MIAKITKDEKNTGENSFMSIISAKEKTNSLKDKFNSKFHLPCHNQIPSAFS